VRLLVAIPALDEQASIGQVLEAIPQAIPGVARIEVLVVDDGSLDATASIAERAGARVLRHGRNRGVGAAFHTALAFAIEHGFDLLATIDADGQFDPEDIPSLVAPVLNHEADFATASRFKDPALVPDMPRAKLWGNRQLARLISRLTGREVYDVSCGMRCYGRQAMLNLNLMGEFTYTQEVFLNLSSKDMRIVEVPVRVRGEREYGQSRVASSLWRYALSTSQIILRAYRDYHPLRFFGGIALLLLAFACCLEIFFFAHYLATGSFSPHKWAGFLGGGLAALSLMLLHIALIGDMLKRHRVYLEELLFRERLKGPSEEARSPDPDEDG
jgi:glycosyltransferase involved in cell wall biosynthesis